MNTNSRKLLFGLKLKNYRKQAGYTQEKLCNILDVDVSGYSKVENGLRFPSLENVCNIMNILKINPNELFDFIDYETHEQNLTDKIIFEQIKNLNNKDKNKVLNFIKLLKD